MQTIFRVDKTQVNYTSISNSFLNDNTLSAKAIGVMCKLLSKPNDWQVIITNIINSFADGKDSIYSAIKELETKGYLVRIKTKNNKGHFINHTFVFEDPTLKNSKEAILSIQEGFSGSNNLNKVITKPITENPPPNNSYSEKTATENPPLLNNDLLNNYKDLPPTPQREIISKNQPAKNSTNREGVFNNHQSFLNHKITNNQTINNNTQQPWYKKIFSKQDTENTNTNFSNKELTLLTPIALKLFGQTNLKILSRLRTEINEFDITPESIDECLKRLDLSKIKANPYKYFAITYTASVTAVVKVKNNSKLELEPSIQQPEFKNNCTSIDIAAKEQWERDTANISNIIKNLAIPITPGLLKVPEIFIPKLARLIQKYGLKWQIEALT